MLPRFLRRWGGVFKACLARYDVKSCAAAVSLLTCSRFHWGEGLSEHWPRRAVPLASPLTQPPPQARKRGRLALA